MGNVKWDFLDTVEALFAKCSLPELPCKTCGHTLFKTFDAGGKPVVNWLIMNCFSSEYWFNFLTWQIWMMKSWGCESVFQIVACSSHDTNCYSLEDGGDAAGPSLTWTHHSSLTWTHHRLYDRTYPGSVFVPNRGIFIFGDISRGTPATQFLPIGSKQWQEGIKYITLVCMCKTLLKKDNTVFQSMTQRI